MNYQNTACIRNILYNYNQRIERIEQNISQMLTNTTSSNKLKNVNGLLIPKFRFATTGPDSGIGYMLEFIVPNLNYTDFNFLPVEVTKDNFYGKAFGSTNDRYIIYNSDYTNTDTFSHGIGFYAYYFPASEPKKDVDTSPRFIGKTLYECGLSSDPDAKITMDETTFLSQTFNLTYNGRPVYITNKEARDFSCFDIFSGGKVAKIGFKLSTQICGCDYALALTAPTTPK